MSTNRIGGSGPIGIGHPGTRTRVSPFARFRFCGAPRGQYALVHGPFRFRSAGHTAVESGRVSRQGPQESQPSGGAKRHYKICSVQMSAERAHDHRRPRHARDPRRLRNFTCGNRIRVVMYERNLTNRTTVRLNPPPDDRGKVDDSPRSRSTRAAPEHTHSVQATKLRRWQYRYMWYGPPYHLFTCPIDCTSLIRS